MTGRAYRSRGRGVALRFDPVSRVDNRKRERASRPPVAPWPLALELSRMGTPIGVCLFECASGDWAVVSVTPDGELVELRRLLPDNSVRMLPGGLGTRPAAHAVRWCLARHLRVFLRLGELVEFTQSGRGLGWLEGRVFEHSAKSGVPPWLVVSRPFDVTLPGEPVVDGFEVASVDHLDVD